MNERRPAQLRRPSFVYPTLLPPSSVRVVHQANGQERVIAEEGLRLQRRAIEAEVAASLDLEADGTAAKLSAGRVIRGGIQVARHPLFAVDVVPRTGANAEEGKELNP